MERTRRRYTDQSRYKRKMPSHSYSSSTRTSAKSTPKHHVSTSTSPITLDPGYLTQFGDCGECLAHHCSCLSHIISGQRGDTTGDSSVATAPLPPPTTAPVSALTTCHLHPCSRPVQPVSHQDQCSGASMNKMSVVDILDDLKCSNNGPDTRRQDTLTRPVSSLAVSCPRAPCIRYDKLKSLSVNVIQNYQCRRTDVDGSKSEVENDIDVVVSRAGGEGNVQDSSTSPNLERQDLINKIGKRIRFRKKKKKEKLKTENRAKKALKTISLILGAFVTCWTPYHILAIIASFCPSCVNIHIYMLSYFLCYANR